MKRLSLFATLLVLVFACSKPLDEQPIDLNGRGNIPDPEIDEGGPGGGGSTCTEPQFGDNLMYFHRGNSSNGLFYAQKTNGSSSYTTGTVNIGATSAGPAYVNLDGRHIIYYKGNSGSNIFYSWRWNYQTNWTGNTYVRNDTKTSAAVSAVKFKCKSFLAYKGNTENTIWVTSSNNGLSGWSTPVSAVTASQNASAFNGNAPYITADDQKLYLIYTRDTDKTVWVKSSTDGVNWSAPTKRNYVQNSMELEALAPAGGLVRDGYLYIAYPTNADTVLTTDNNDIAFGRYNLASPASSPTFDTFGAMKTTKRVSITSTNSGSPSDKLVLVYRGGSYMYSSESQNNGVSWTTPVSNGQSQTAPYIASY